MLTGLFLAAESSFTTVDRGQAVRGAGGHLGRVVEDGTVPGVVAVEDVLEQLSGDVRDASLDDRASTAAERARPRGAGWSPWTPSPPRPSRPCHPR